MALYAVFRALGLKIEVLPIMGKPRNLSSADRLYFGGLDVKNAGWRPSISFDDMDEDEDEDEDEGGHAKSVPEATNLGDYRDFETRLQSILRNRKIDGISRSVDPVIVGQKLHNLVSSDRGGSDRESQSEVCSSLGKDPHLLRKNPNSHLAHLDPGRCLA